MTEAVFTTPAKLSALKDALNVFIPTWLPEKTKESIERQVRAAYASNVGRAGCYDLQLTAISIIDSIIEISHPLWRNYINIGVIIDEYRTLKKALNDVRKYLEKLKFNESKANVDEMLAAIKIDVDTLMLEDISAMCKAFKPTVAVAAHTTKFKTS